MGEAMALGKYGDRKIVASFYYNLSMGALCFLFKKGLFTLDFQVPRGQKVSRLLATSFKIRVANT